MYDRPETVDSFDLFWSYVRNGIQDAGIKAPERLIRGRRASKTAWIDEGLLLSQTCGLPFRTFLRGKVSLVGTPDYGYRNCPRGYYFSCLVAGAVDSRSEFRQFEGGRLAVNDFSSQSGWAAPLAEAKRIGIRFGSLLRSGSHRSSALAVAEGRADLASLDANSWRLIQRYDSFASTLRSLELTRPTPGLPFISAFPEFAGILFEAIENALHQLPNEAADIIGYRRLASLAESHYAAVDDPPSLPSEHSEIEFQD